MEASSFLGDMEKWAAHATARSVPPLTRETIRNILLSEQINVERLPLVTPE